MTPLHFILSIGCAALAALWCLAMILNAPPEKRRPVIPDEIEQRARNRQARARLAASIPRVRQRLEWSESPSAPTQPLYPPTSRLTH